MCSFVSSWIDIEYNFTYQGLDFFILKIIKIYVKNVRDDLNCKVGLHNFKLLMFFMLLYFTTFVIQITLLDGLI